MYNANPSGRHTGDCVIRALSAAIGVDWESAYVMLCAKGYSVYDLPNSNAVLGSVLKDFGFKRQAISNTCPDCYTFADFTNDHPKGTFVLGTGEHVATVKDGKIYDSWNSSNEIPQYYWEKG